METEKAVLLMAELLDILMGCVLPDCGLDCDGCKYSNQCGQMTKAWDTNLKLQSLLATNKEPAHIWVDGWCKNNGKPNAQAGWTVVAIVNGKRDSTNRGLVHGPQTNNVAEYHAFINGLHWGKQYNRPIVIHTDSALVIGQLTNNWQVKSTHLRAPVEEAKAVMRETGATIVKEPREKIVEILGH